MASQRAVCFIAGPAHLRTCLHGLVYRKGTNPTVLAAPFSLNLSTDTGGCKADCSAYISLSASRFSRSRPSGTQGTLHTLGRTRVGSISLNSVVAGVPIVDLSSSTVRFFSTSGARRQEAAASVAANPVDVPNAPSSESAFVIPEPPPIPAPLPDGGELVLQQGTSDLTALGLGGWWPPGIFQQALDMLHSAGLPWWGAIGVATFVLRVLVFPLALKAQRSSAVLQQKMPELQRLQMKMTDARNHGDSLGAAMAGQELQVLMKEGGFNPLKSMLPMLAQGPIFISVFLGLRRMANAPVESMKDGGLFWFTDLTVPDPYYILPILTCVTLLGVVELASEGGGGGAAPSSQGQRALMKIVLRAMPVIMFPFMAKFPAAMLCYWFTSNVFSLAQVAIFRIPSVRVALKLPKIIRHNPDALPMKKKGMRESFRESMQNSRIAREIGDRTRIDSVRFREAGMGPIQKTYKYDPTKRPKEGVKKKANE